MIHAYYGNGKGKTTAAVGLAIRAAGAGRRVLFAQFLKSGQTSELNILEKIPNIECLAVAKMQGFLFEKTEAEKEQIINDIKKQLQGIEEWIKIVSANSGSDDKILVVMDEVLHCLKMSVIDEEKFIESILRIGQQTEIVLTGAEPSAKLNCHLDYVTEMVSHKHPYERGIAARPGIEY